jgi:hypothetical protein
MDFQEYAFEGLCEISSYVVCFKLRSIIFWLSGPRLTRNESPMDAYLELLYSNWSTIMLKIYITCVKIESLRTIRGK